MWLSSVLGIASLLLPAIATLLAFGPLLFLADPPIASRVLVGLGPLLVAGLLVMNAAFRRWGFSRRWTVAAGSMFGVGMCVVASAYGNAMDAQKTFEDHIGTRLADDIAKVGAKDPLQSLLLDGSAGYAPVTAHVIEQFPIVGFQTPTYIAAEDTFHTHIFLLHYLPAFVDLRLEKDSTSEAQKTSLFASVCAREPVEVRSGYRVYVVDGVAVVLFGTAYLQRCPSGLRAMGDTEPP
jgi:hypothetical protein